MLRLQTKLIAAATGLTFTVVLAVSCIFMAELLGARIAQTAAANGALASEVISSARQAIEAGVRAHPPTSDSPEAFADSVADALRSSQALSAQMRAIVRYWPTVQDVSITNAHGTVLLSTDVTAVDQPALTRTGFDDLMRRGFLAQARMVFGRPQVLDEVRSLDLNSAPLIYVHLGVRSTFVSYNYAPWLRGMLLVIGFSLLSAVAAAALLSSLALRPLGAISRQLDVLTAGASEPPALPAGRREDAAIQVAQKIDVLGRQMRSSAEEYSMLRSNLNRVMDALRDCVVLFAGDRRAILVSESTADLLGKPLDQIVQRQVEEIFEPGTVLGDAIAGAFRRSFWTHDEKLTLEDGRRVSFSLEWIAGAAGQGKSVGGLLTLRDVETMEKLEREIDLSQRLAAIGRLTAGVGHEVKNPINSMVLHLELLKTKLAQHATENGAARHLEVLTNEMARLDRVVQTLADFSRPVELQLVEQDLREALHAVLNLAAVELEEARISVETDEPRRPVQVLIDAELIRQVVLNIVLNAQQALSEEEPDGRGRIRIRLRTEGNLAVLSIADNGPGIPAEVLPSIFDLYFTTKAKGSGIGLAMVYRILQMHGGTIEASSEAAPDSPARGTTFTLRLPLARPSQPQLVAGQVIAEGLS
jgi:signal transduction histidine kinase